MVFNVLTVNKTNLWFSDVFWTGVKEFWMCDEVDGTLKYKN